jgi:hypothetical protein
MIPGARRLINSLRDLGYDFSSAVADIVDNSIGARAKTVTINVNFAADDSWVCIADDGEGMSPAKLREAMRYGAERSYELDELGKFGLGLKTASLSQCQCLTVATRSGEDRARITAYCWDLSHIERTNRWEITSVDVKTHIPDLTPTLRASTGTVVLWQRLDRMLGYQYGENARKRLANMCRELEQHLSMVFHRFLAGQVRGKKLSILLNGNPIRPWDPYALNEPNTRAFESEPISVATGATSGLVTVAPYILPAQSRFSSPAAFTAASGPNKWNRQQGLYIYRAGRLIQSGGWSGLRTLDEHTKLARIALSFGPELDDAFKINVAKMRVQLPLTVRTALEEILGPVMKQANKAYRDNSGKVITVLPSAKTGPPQQTGTNVTASGTDVTSTAGPVNVAASTDIAISPRVTSATSSENERAGQVVDTAQLNAVIRLLNENATPEEAQVLGPLLARVRIITGALHTPSNERDTNNVNFA